MVAKLNVEWYKPLPIRQLKNWYVIPTIFQNWFFDAGGISKKASIEILHAQRSGETTDTVTSRFHTLLWANCGVMRNDMPYRSVELCMYGTDNTDQYRDHHQKDLYARVKLNLDTPDSNGTICLAPRRFSRNGKVVINSCNTMRVAPILFELSNNTIGAQFTYAELFAAVSKHLIKELADDMISIFVGLQLCQRNGDTLTVMMNREVFDQTFILSDIE